MNSQAFLRRVCKIENIPQFRRINQQEVENREKFQVLLRLILPNHHLSEEEKCNANQASP